MTMTIMTMTITMTLIRDVNEQRLLAEATLRRNNGSKLLGLVEKSPVAQGHISTRGGYHPRGGNPPPSP